MQHPEILTQKILTTGKNIVIICHSGPDGDAIGSSLGLYHFLKIMGHHPQVIVPDDYPGFLKWMPASDKVLNHALNKLAAEDKIAMANMIFYLDFNALSRIGKLGKTVNKSNAFKVLIDHHTMPEDIADIMISDPTACATALLVYEMIAALEKTEDINAQCAACLYAGILTDTGSFRFPSTTAHTLQVAAKLIEKGADNALIYAKIFDNYSEQRLRLMGYLLKDKMNILPQYNTAIIPVEANELSEYNYVKGDTEGIVNYPLSITNIVMSVIIMEKDGKVKLSFRSKGQFKVNEIAGKYFEGGGHINAAGGLSRLSVQETVEKIVAFLPEYKKQLNDEAAKIL